MHIIYTGEYRDTKTNFNGIVKIVIFVSLYSTSINNMQNSTTLRGGQEKNKKEKDTHPTDVG